MNTGYNIKNHIPLCRDEYAQGYPFVVVYWWHHNAGDDTEHCVFYTENPLITKKPGILKDFKKIQKRALGRDFMVYTLKENGEAEATAPVIAP
jgi:hypothetical protein